MVWSAVTIDSYKMGWGNNWSFQEFSFWWYSPLISRFDSYENRKSCLWNNNSAKSQIFSEKYWYYFHCPKNVLCSILSFVFWIFLPLDTTVQLKSADSKQNPISKYIFQDSFRHIFWAMKKMHHTFWKKATFIAGIKDETYRQVAIQSSTWQVILHSIRMLPQKWFQPIVTNILKQIGFHFPTPLV